MIPKKLLTKECFFIESLEMYKEIIIVLPQVKIWLSEELSEQKFDKTNIYPEILFKDE